MTVSIPGRNSHLLAWETKAFAFLAIIRKDGRPHVSPVWFDFVDGLIIINTARRRVKDWALRRRGPVSLAIADPKDPYRYLRIDGRVVSESEVGGFEQICKLNEKYHGKNEYPRRPGEIRVTYRIEPVAVFPAK
jgi:PPOX class probable F420-dependent enzyme